MIKYCSNCPNPSTRPNISFNKKGLCTVCVYELRKKKKQINWNNRWMQIQKIKKWGKKNSNSSHDCIVTVSGGKDSFRQAFYVRDKLKMNPLLVALTYPPEQYSERGPKNLSTLIEHGFDCISLSLDPVVWKKLMKKGFLKFGNYAKSTEMALYAAPIHIAIAYKIPLIFYGENPANTQGERHGKRLDGNASGIRYGNTIKGGPRTIGLKNISNKDLHFYEYPKIKDVELTGLKIVYLGYFIKDWYGSKNANFAKKKGLKIRDDKPDKIGDIWGVTGLDEDFRIVNQYIKFLKYGFGFVTSQVIEMMHKDKLNIKKGIDLINKYDGKCDIKYKLKLCKYLGISLKKFNRTIDNFVNKKIFKYQKNKYVKKTILKPEMFQNI